MTKEEQFAELSRFEYNAPAAIRSGQDYDSFSKEYRIGNTYRYRYLSMIDEHIEAERERKRKELEATKLEREAAAAMGIIE